MAKDNRELFSMDWQEQSDSSWVTMTVNYKLVALPKDPEYVSEWNGNWVALLYRWDDGESTWVQVSKEDSKGDQEAKVHAEKLLGQHLDKLRREADPDLRKLDIVKAIQALVMDELMAHERHMRDPRFADEMRRRLQYEEDERFRRYNIGDVMPPVFPRP